MGGTPRGHRRPQRAESLTEKLRSRAFQNARMASGLALLAPLVRAIYGCVSWSSLGSCWESRGWLVAESEVRAARLSA